MDALTCSCLEATKFGRHVMDPEDELNRLWARSSAPVQRGLKRVIVAHMAGTGKQAALNNLARMFGQAMAWSDLLGRRRLLLEHDAALDRVPPELREMAIFDERGHGEAGGILPDVPFEEAIRDLVSREPRLAGTAEEVAALYRERHGFAAAGLAEQATLARVRDLLIKRATGGLDRPTVTSVIESLTGFTRAHADTVQRTNLTTSYTAGRFAQARDKDIEPAFGAFFRYEIIDSDVRRGRPNDRGENHSAVHGLVASVRDSVWRFASPPAGYNCRGGVRMLSKREIKSMGLLDSNGRVVRREPASFGSYSPHPRFRDKPDPFTRIYGSAA